ncbi:hypothetical protein [Paraburkholderia fungorum]|uniref:MFS transporter n=1 Tax=Paraburkholderia fungorum TaxID=134537 RepID=A0AAW3V1E5_9BURK|nr:hypothetical protein [Paraburkholderia fungorum]MBB4517276.1 hypothetical protein [Paraburkholderia fungorum]MBB6204344.1 hypothetical protein [Paraburkholderia fungorum]
MQFLGVTLRRPTFNDLTFAAALGTAVFAVYELAMMALGVHETTRSGLLFFVGTVWGALSNRIGINLTQGWRAKVLFLIGLGLLVMAPAIFVFSAR